MPVMEVSVIPVGTGSTSISPFVKGALRALKKEKGIKYRLTAMGTLIEANSVDRLLKVAGKLHKSVFSVKTGTGRARRVLTALVIDDRRDKKLTIAGKVGSAARKKR